MGDSKKVTKKTIWLSIPPKEYQIIIELISRTTCRSMSEYARKSMLGKPIKVFYRNKSFDEFVEIAILLKKRLDAILIAGLYAGAEKEALAADIKVIKEYMIKIYDHERKNKAQQKPI
jgi:hypothetical protein